jgi:hypothetical protein
MSTQENLELLRATHRGSLDRVKRAVEGGADIEYVEPGTGLTALHMAVGRSHLDIAKYLIEEAGAAIKPDGFGRWPTVIAAQCRSSEAVCDYIVEREAEAVNSGSQETSTAREIDFD